MHFQQHESDPQPQTKLLPVTWASTCQQLRHYSVRGSSDEVNSVYIRTLIQSTNITLLLGLSLKYKTIAYQIYLNSCWTKISAREKTWSQGAYGGIQPNPQRFDTQCLSHNLMYCGLLLMTSHTLRHAEKQNHFFPLTHIPEIRPQIKLMQTQSIFWSLSKKNEHFF